MELNIITGKIESPDGSKWWAETTNLNPNVGIELANSTEKEAVLVLVNTVFARMEVNAEITELVGEYDPEVCGDLSLTREKNDELPEEY